MSRFRSLCLFLGFVAFAGTFVFVARRLYAGPERIAISCACASLQCGSMVIPVTVAMASDGPDYVDMVYNATDVNGNPVACSPSSNRLYVAKGTPVTDNVSITCTSNTNFSATGTGETGGDTGAGGCTIACAGGCGVGVAATVVHPTAPAGAAPASTTINFNQNPTTNYVWVMPIEIQLPPPSGAGANPIKDQVQMSYSATSSSSDGSTGNVCTCVPATELVNLYSGALPGADVYPYSGDLHGVLMRHIAIRSPKKSITALSLNVNATGLQNGVVGSGQWSFMPSSATGGVGPTPQNGGGGVLQVGYNPNTAANSKRTLVQFVEHVVQVNPSLAANDVLRMKFFATDSAGQTLDCQPARPLPARSPRARLMC